MPNYDAGHYFLTVLAPIRMDPELRDGQTHSRRHLIREALSWIPSGEKTAASRGKSRDNPFARTTRTHFARFFVLDDVIYNGRVSGNALWDRLTGVDPLDPQPVDRLTTPYLYFGADFDARSGADADRNAYLTALWDTMEPELTDIFRHCIGFDSVKSASDFCAYIAKCQIETTMPFNDYWSAPPALSDISLIGYVIGAVIGVLSMLAALFYGVVWFIAGLLILIVSVVLAYYGIINKAAVPFPVSAPPAPQSDLPTVLKSLYVQRAFTRFAIKTQGADDETLHTAFGQFLAETEPTNLSSPTQKPGVIGV